ncbi:LytTR family transcriptional regulator [Prevotella sp. PCHR]|uniref:LytTR family transcriptional regulator n=1 Tax=Xylanibacter caecicola TaxID=2736294 RepID=A0ABX2B2K3_9BACT|nr:LytTR family transcriptional regulator DNA-binding domain-containing protein [Xylanibacter caecicola]NPE25646.1 LytTR family transcriptional regulator [Xylanibacter caecicola]
MNAVTQRDTGTPPIILVVNAINEHQPLTLYDIGYFRYNQERKLWEVVCCDGQTQILRRHSTADIILNYSPSLVQIHKRFIVNIERIKKIQESRCILDAPLSHINELKISKNYRHSLMQAFYNL